MYVCVCTMFMLGAHGGQKKAVAPLEVKLGSCELLHGCWDPNLRPLQEQVIFTTEPSSNPIVICYKTRRRLETYSLQKKCSGNSWGDSNLANFWSFWVCVLKNWLMYFGMWDAGEMNPPTDWLDVWMDCSIWSKLRKAPEHVFIRFFMYKLVAWVRMFMTKEHRRHGGGLDRSVEWVHVSLEGILILYR